LNLVRNFKRSLKRLLWKFSPKIVYRLIPEGKTCFSIGIYAGSSPFDLRPAPRASNPVLAPMDITEAPTGTVADPFMLAVGETWYMFFELTNLFNNKGEIALATSQDGLEWTFEQIVISEPFHMSYPYVFEWENDIYMVPETGRNKSVRLYKADRFPTDWTFIATLLEGGRFADTSFFRSDNRWWLFTDAGIDAKSPLLRLYFADELQGPWTEHPSSPLANGDPHISRPGGRVIVVDDTPYRFTQNVYPVYGTELRAFEIYELSTTTYGERQVGDKPILGPGTDTWNRHGMHHMDAHQLADGSWLACVDGCIRRDFDESQLSSLD
jgi:hypothetical protein